MHWTYLFAALLGGELPLYVELTLAALLGQIWGLFLPTVDNSWGRHVCIGLLGRNKVLATFTQSIGKKKDSFLLLW